MFSTQLHYEGRFEADDKVHRILKAVHVLLFVYIGITADKWSLKNIVVPEAVEAAKSDAGLWVTHRKPSPVHRAYSFRAGRPELYDCRPCFHRPPHFDRSAVSYG